MFPTKGILKTLFRSVVGSNVVGIRCKGRAMLDDECAQFGDSCNILELTKTALSEK